MTESEALALVRLQRHSFLNHLQVIGGWLQLGQAERASGYLAKVVSAMAAEQEALAGAPEALRGALVELFLQAEGYGVEVSIQFAGTPPPDAAAKVRSLLLEAVQAAHALPADQRALRAVLTATGLTVQFAAPVLWADLAQPQITYEAALP